MDSSAKANQDVVIKRKFVIAVIIFQVVSLIGGSYLLHSSNKKYNQLIDVESANFDTFQKWTSVSNQNFMRLFELIQTKDSHQIDSIYAHWEQTNTEINNYISSISQNAHFDIHKNTLFKTLIDNRLAYLRNVSKLKESKQTIDKNTEKYFLSVVKPSFILFQDNLSNFVKSYQNDIIIYNNQLNETSNASMWGILFFGFFPIISLVIIFALMLFYLLWIVHKIGPLDSWV